MTRRKPEVELPTATSRVLSWSQVRQRVPLARTTVWKLRRAGVFPQPIRLSAGRVGWVEKSIDEWVAVAETP